MIESVRNYMANCPHLKNGRLNVDFLGHKRKEFSIETEPVNPVVKQYVNGDSIRQFVFLIVFRGPYGMDLKQNTANIELFEKITDWLEAQNQQQNFPLLAENQDAISIKALSQGFAYQTGIDTARYQMQCQLLYYQTKEEI